MESVGEHYSNRLPEFYCAAQGWLHNFSKLLEITGYEVFRVDNRVICTMSIRSSFLALGSVADSMIGDV